jgi:hypothetical protein
MRRGCGRIACRQKKAFLRKGEKIVAGARYFLKGNRQYLQPARHQNSRLPTRVFQVIGKSLSFQLEKDNPDINLGLFKDTVKSYQHCEKIDRTEKLKAT